MTILIEKKPLNQDHYIIIYQPEFPTKFRYLKTLAVY